MRYCLLLCLCFIIAPVTAIDEVPTPTDYPTLEALQQTVIPIADRTDLAQRFLGVQEIPPVPTSAAPRTVGERQQFNIAQTQNSTTATTESELMAIGEHIYVWCDYPCPIPISEAENFAARFDSEIYDQTRALWGSEVIPGIDGDPRVYAVFTDDVMRGIAAYFAAQNSYSRSVFPLSNEHDMMIFNRNAFDAIDSDETVSIAAHEFQHMIRSTVDSNETAWVDEGFSMLTEYLLGYPIDDVTDLFLSDTDYQLNTWGMNGGIGADYGASALFMLYFYERYGAQALREVSDHRANGLQAFDSILQQRGEPDINTFFADWVIANVVDGVAPYGYPNDDFRIRPRVISEQPTRVENTLSQYATDYFVPRNISDSIMLNLTMPSTAKLFNSDRETTVFYSNRGDDSNTRLTHAFDLRGIFDNAELSYDLWYDIEEGWDYVYISVSNDGGATWIPQSTRYTTQDDPFGKAYGEGYTGSSDGWVRDTVDLTPYLNQTIFVRFDYVTDDATNYAGLAIDNVRLDALNYVADFEDDNGGWASAGWIRTDNRLPQQGWLQVIERNDNDITLTRWQVAGDVTYTHDLQSDTESVIVAFSPFAPVTTEPTDYVLVVE